MAKFADSRARQRERQRLERVQKWLVSNRLVMLSVVLLGVLGAGLESISYLLRALMSP